MKNKNMIESVAKQTKMTLMPLIPNLQMGTALALAFISLFFFVQVIYVLEISSGSNHNYNQVLYFPIVAAAIAYGRTAGVLVGFAATCITGYYTPELESVFHPMFSDVLRTTMFCGLGYFAGSLSYNIFDKNKHIMHRLTSTESKDSLNQSGLREYYYRNIQKVTALTFIRFHFPENFFSDNPENRKIFVKKQIQNILQHKDINGVPGFINKGELILVLKGPKDSVSEDLIHQQLEKYLSLEHCQVYVSYDVSVSQVCGKDISFENAVYFVRNQKSYDQKDFLGNMTATKHAKDLIFNNLSVYRKTMFDRLSKEQYFLATPCFTENCMVLDSDKIMKSIQHTNLTSHVFLTLLQTSLSQIHSRGRYEQTMFNVRLQDFTPSTIETLNNALEYYQTSSKNITLGISEDDFMKNTQYLGLINKLKAKGFHIVLINFSGMSLILEHLKNGVFHEVHFSKDQLKIVGNPKESLHYKAAVSYLHALGAKVGQEGIYTQAQFKLFKQSKVDLFCGPLFEDQKTGKKQNNSHRATQQISA